MRYVVVAEYENREVQVSCDGLNQAVGTVQDLIVDQRIAAVKLVKTAPTLLESE